MPTLYELGVEYARLETLLIEQAGEWTEETEAAFAALGEIERSKIDAYEAVIANLTGHASACQDESNRLQDKATVALNAAKRLKARLLEYMQARGVEELKGEKWRAVIQKNGGLRKLTLLVPPEDLPAAFQRMRVEANTDELRTLIGDADYGDWEGRPLARLEERGVSLRFK